MRKRFISMWLFVAVVVALLVPYLFLPSMDMPGTDIASEFYPLDEARTRFLADYTGFDLDSQERHLEQEIFDEILSMIAAAETMIVADFFLINPWEGWLPANNRQLSRELAQALIKKKRSEPKVRIILLTDPVNRIYGLDKPDFFAEMVDAGISVVFTDLDRLPHSNMLYSPWAATYGRFISNLPLLRGLFEARIVPNVLEAGGPKIKLRQIFRLLHFKANHRKVLITDLPGGELKMLVTSLNPADGSAPNSNVAISTVGPVAAVALASELDIVQWSSEKPELLLGDSREELMDTVKYARSFTTGYPQPEIANGARIQWLTEDAIRRRILSLLNRSGPGDLLRIAIFYCSDREVVDAIIAAAKRGAAVRMILDANRDAFGREKNGIPNIVVAADILAATRSSGHVTIRWGATHGAQFHTKSISVSNPEKLNYSLLTGSANWTRRNLQNLNLESSFYIEGESDIVHHYNHYFDRVWDNDDRLVFTVPYEEEARSGVGLLWKRIVYQIQETIGAGTF